ncbi:L-seryl-tRNA(Sec) selenium transferase [Xenorhabdus sp. DI]|uniref:L-seryl-tRNA(Sec) selenium transferase n=1 Tax=Xenorhabdus doucetiae TaxID=351671 RepID=UPI0019965024|nr:MULTISPECIES: L-seryl-tRNA(Sec) selenium transferase [unclassified Xenorhabdus]MBD2784183.1 L-seryl-tRNA(Sec) selenium transferase [Xenorhabdus sp. 3]MBD2790287.1 L-seryl-tRNA(Sec) selenium transferase [Xenorhabdus sp. DI]
MTQAINSLYRQLPSVDTLLREPEITLLIAAYGQTQVVAMLRAMQEQARFTIREQQALPEWSHDWAASLQRRLDKAQTSALKPVFNLSGTVLHTNLGRALLAESAIDAVAQAMRSPVTLEYSLDGAGRGHRDRALADLLCTLTGAEDACIVNNNAAAVLLVLATVAQGKEVIVSRGELVEIGGAFRIPDMMRQAGCRLVEVGTTNRTHLKDYRQAINADTGMLMKVHTSNYQIEGFTADVAGEALAKLGMAAQIPTAVDLGSGSMIDMTQYGLPAEPMPQDYLNSGIDLVTFSGDKLLGGPQAGIIVGKKQWIEAIQQQPLKRALRADKMTLAALEATLRLYQHPEQLHQKLPTLRLLTRPQSEIREMAQQLLPPIRAYYSEKFIVRDEPCYSQIGSGSLPVDRLPSWALTFTAIDGRGSTLEKLAHQWRNLEKPVIGRLYDGRLWLDLRCLEEANELLQVLVL